MVGLTVFARSQWLRTIGQTDFTVGSRTDTEIVSKLPIIEIMTRLKMITARVGRNLVLF